MENGKKWKHHIEYWKWGPRPVWDQNDQNQYFWVLSLNKRNPIFILVISQISSLIRDRWLNLSGGPVRFHTKMIKINTFE